MVRPIIFESLAQVLSALDAYGLERLCLEVGVVGCVGIQRRHHSDLDMLVPVGDFAKCVHILKHDLGFAWKSNVCFLTGCQKLELVSEEGDLVEVLVMSEERIEYDSRAYCSQLKHRSMLYILHAE